VSVDPILAEVIANRYRGSCVLNKCQDLIKLRDRAIQYRMLYIPSRVDTLLMGESPPAKVAERYFYAPGEVRNGTLFYYTTSVLFEKEMKNCKNRQKEYFLNMFKDHGFYLIDMAKRPINRLVNKDDKRKALESCTQYLTRELDALGFERVRTIFVGKGSFEIVSRKLDLTSDRVICLPFGSQKNVEKYKTGLKQNLRK